MQDRKSPKIIYSLNSHMGKYYYYSHIIDEKIKVRRVK